MRNVALKLRRGGLINKEVIYLGSNADLCARFAAEFQSAGDLLAGRDRQFVAHGHQAQAHLCLRRKSDNHAEQGRKNNYCTMTVYETFNGHVFAIYLQESINS